MVLVGCTGYGSFLFHGLLGMAPGWSLLCFFLSHFFSGFSPATRPGWDQMYFYLRVVDPVNQSLKSFENQKKYDSLFVLMAFWCI